MAEQMEHGKLYQNGRVRWCGPCKEYHGPLYPCDHYSTALLLTIDQEIEQMQINLSDPAWCKAQVNQGMPPEGIHIFRLFAGLD